MKLTNREPITVGVLLLLWLVAELVGQFVGNFPTNDDWIYGYMVQSMLAGKYVLTGWTLNTTITHIIAGALPCFLFGFSFDTVRIVTIFWGMVTLACTWQLVKRCGAPFWYIVFSVILVATDPLFFSLTHTFMTDIPSLAMSIVGTLAFVEFWRTGKKSFFVYSILAVTIAGLCRQATLVTPASFAIAYLVANKRSMSNFVHAVLPLGISCICALVYKIVTAQAFGHLWCETVEHAYLQQVVSQGPLLICIVILGNLVRLSLYLGGIMLPLLLLVTPKILGSVEKKTRIFLAMLLTELVVMMAGGMLWNGQTMPLAENLIYDSGLGPFTLTIGLASQCPWAQAAPGVWKAITLLCAVGAAFFWTYFILFLVRIIKSIRSGEVAQEDKFALVSYVLMVIYFTTLVIHNFYDRYLVFCVPFLAVIFVRLAFQYPSQAKIAPLVFQVTAGVFTLALTWYSFAGTHDYFTWNRVRWQAIKAATALGATKETMDGGLEYNLWEVYTSGKPIPPLSENPYPYHNDAFVISGKPLPSFTVSQTFPFQRWLVPGEEKIFLLTKNKN